MGYVGNNESAVTEEVRCAIETVEKCFRNNPLDYTIETALTGDIVTYLRDQLGHEIPARAGYLPNPPANYKHPYLKTLNKGQSVRNIQPEVNIGLSTHFDEHVSDCESVITEIDANNARIDIGILEPAAHPLFTQTQHCSADTLDIPQEALEVCIAKGSKYYPPRAVTHAIEVKFIKDRTRPGTGLDEVPPMTWDRISGDLNKLEHLAKYGAGGDGAECHLVIASNMNIFQMGLDEDHSEYRPKYRRRLYNLVQYCEKQEGRKRIHIWDIHPPRAEDNDSPEQ